MGRTAIVSHLVEEQLSKYAAENKFCVGLLVGQPNADGKDYIIYAVRSPIHVDDACEKSEGAPNSKTPSTSCIESLDPQLLVNHAVIVTRIIPGCFFVQGMFVVCEKNIFQDDVAAKKVRQCITDINKILSDHKVFRSDTHAYDNNEKLILHCAPHKTRTCRSLNISETPGSFKPADWKVLDKSVPWHMFETNYDLDEVFPLFVDEKVCNLEENFQLSLKTINSYLERSAVFIQQDQYDDNILLETLIKTKKEKKEKVDVFKASIFFPASITETDLSQIVQVHGTVRYSGIVYSRIWVHPQTTLSDIKQYIRNDILRSMAVRIQMYCDSLTEPNVQEGDFIVSEPPRRVFIKVPGTGGIEFSEYLFRGELVDIVVEQSREMLDLSITSANVETELEALPTYDDDVSSLSDVSFTSSNSQLPGSEVRRNMYLVGILGAMVILILSLILHFVLR